MDLNLAVISDMHCQSRNESPITSYLNAEKLRLPANQHPIESLKELISNEHLSADIVLCPGDITDKISISGYNFGWACIKEIKESLHSNTIAATIGNHDVDSRDNHEMGFDTIPKGIGTDFPVDSAVARTSFWGNIFVF